ncbi:CRP-like cAMP-binding protein [Pseudorhizobium tarimense]|uniref:CRP-like cAMP-binding protein n=1 Tax=Pseudorhizobium tarimense TaxID=1079109 RepID=A0ABV2H520_9HYPH|nr:Crp/Fnr family transcriptional regulator [Pseudorhizobium tarimense]MCJ8518860.1 Crp/Fnr family transcriptional regulator [Pseudorhizobium tarimense]
MIETNNHLLKQLSSQDAALLTPMLEHVDLKQNDILFEPLQEIPYVYFFNGGLSSEVATNADGQRIEVGCIGYEGFSSVPVILGAGSSPHRSFMQAGASALRIGSADLRGAMAASLTLSSLLMRFAHVFMCQIAATALADGRYKVEQRLARWLLMSQDRLGQELPLTHDFLGLMLGVRRPSVTDALHVLEGERAITAERMLIKVRDRSKLETFAGDAYGAPEAEYRRVISHKWPA